MKALAKQMIARSARVPLLGRLYRVLYHVHRISGAVYHASLPRPVAQESDLDAELARLSLSDLSVRHGPFAGMRYPSARSFGSTLLPKLIGSYEQELHPVIAALGADYSAIVDIGCAEGYYAVGMALRNPGAHVYAFDTNADAQRQCLATARENGVESRVTVAGLCDADTLRRLPLGPHALVICDCEGYERQLLDDRMAEHLRDHDLIVETHDFIDIEISTAIKRALAGTHDLTSIYSTDDIQKALTTTYPETAALPLEQRRLALREGRPCIMEWVVARSRG